MVGSTRSCCSDELESYFMTLARGLDECMDIARRAKAQGFDAVLNVRYETSQVMPNALEIVAYGTAIRRADR